MIAEPGSPACPDGQVPRVAALLRVVRLLLVMKPTIRGIETERLLCGI